MKQKNAELEKRNHEEIQKLNKEAEKENDD